MIAKPLLLAAGSLGLSAPALAQGIPDHGHFFGRDNWGFGAMMVFGPLFFLVFLAVAVAVVVLLVRWLGEGRSYAAHPPSMGWPPLASSRNGSHAARSTGKSSMTDGACSATRRKTP